MQSESSRDRAASVSPQNSSANHLPNASPASPEDRPSNEPMSASEAPDGTESEPPLENDNPPGRDSAGESPHASGASSDSTSNRGSSNRRDGRSEAAGSKSNHDAPQQALEAAKKTHRAAIALERQGATAKALTTLLEAWEQIQDHANDPACRQLRGELNADIGRLENTNAGKRAKPTGARKVNIQ